jgi:Flp pilus assembly pilin Flp
MVHERLVHVAERGQGLVEYSLVLSVVSIACAGALLLFGGSTNGLFAQILARLAAAFALTP